MGPKTLRTRKALLAGAVGVALSGAGAALAWSAGPPSATPSPSPSASPSTPGHEGRGATPDASQRPQFQHGESVVKKADGTFQTVLGQRGTVEAVSSTSITVRSGDGFTQAYTVNADTRVTRNGTIADIATGDVVRVAGVRDGDTATAQRITGGGGDHPGPGRGHGHGHGHGGNGNGNGNGKAHGQGQANPSGSGA
ncbi:hypothetical protein QE394_000463 [Arthrobacter sp. SORGH_AS 212]|uniref:DUF5666 domain-containing protein n=1 Tax=Pseudarthrobacter sp. SORGH_AS 212 TaxID=3041777 RepID=UPI0027878063|nr:hypothetical protein [Arthrobacter sp. SORGH_AS_0212]